MMTVKNLIDELKRYDLNSEVKLVSNDSFPSGYSVEAVISRAEMPGEETEVTETDKLTDVFIVEGIPLG